MSRTARSNRLAARRRTLLLLVAGIIPVAGLLVPAGALPTTHVAGQTQAQATEPAGPSPVVAPVHSLLARIAEPPAPELGVRTAAAAGISPHDQADGPDDGHGDAIAIGGDPTGGADLEVLPEDVAPREPPFWEARRSHLEMLVRNLGFDYGSILTDADLFRAAERLGIDVGESIDPGDVDRLIHVHRQRASAAIRSLGFDHGSAVVNEDLLRAADELGVDVGAYADPTDVVRIIRAVDQRVDARRAGLSSTRVARAGTPLIASTDGVAIHVPSAHVVMLGFHQAAGATRQLRPHPNVPMMTLPSRGRGTGSRTAVDISVEPETTVVSPVNGTVVEVQNYALYGRYNDVRISIVPSDNPRVLVSVLHVSGPRISVGDRVEAGRTPIAARSTQFPFASQIDRFAGRYPHVHIEIRRR